MVGYYANDYIGYLILIDLFVLLPLLMLCSLDTLRDLNKPKDGSKLLRIFQRILSSFPSFVFGVLSLLIGITIIVWVLYNYLIERQDSFTSKGLFSLFGIGPAMVIFGVRSIFAVFGKNVKDVDYAEIKDPENFF